MSQASSFLPLALSLILPLDRKGLRPRHDVGRDEDRFQAGTSIRRAGWTRLAPAPACLAIMRRRDADLRKEPAGSPPATPATVLQAIHQRQTVMSGMARCPAIIRKAAKTDAPGQLTLTRRGFAFCPFGRMSVITPSFIWALMLSCSILLEI